MKESDREKIKLRANYLNGVALIFLSLGGLGPAFVALQGLDTKGIIGALIWLWAAGMSSWELHEMAQKQLSKLDATDTLAGEHKEVGPTIPAVSDEE